MEDYGIFKGEELLLVVGSKEKAETMSKNYPGSSIAPVIEVNKKWVRK